MSKSQNVVVIHAGTKVSPFLSMLIDSRKIHFSVIANTLLDISIPGDKEGVSGWISKELISLASNIIRDDLTSSPLASLFSKSKSIDILQKQLSPSEQFLASWFSDIRSDQKTAFEKTIKVFETLTAYSNLGIKIYPLSYQQKKPIAIKYRNQSGSPRSYQLYGYLDLKKKTEIDPADLSASMKEEKEADAELLDEKESLVPAEIEKILKEADAVIISADDFFSLAIMLRYSDVRKSIKKSSGSVLTIAPIGSRFTLNEREKVLLEMFKIEPTIDGFLKIMKDVSDTLAIDTGDSAIVSAARESGFNVIVEDLLKIENKMEYLAVILKGAGIDATNFTVDVKPAEVVVKSQEIGETKLNEMPQVQVKASNPEEIVSTPENQVSSETNGQTTPVPEQQEPNKEQSETPAPTTVSASTNGSSKLDKSATVAKSSGKVTADADKEVSFTTKNETAETNKVEQSVVQENGNGASSEETNQNQVADNQVEVTEDETNTREQFVSLMNKFNEEPLETIDSWVTEAEKYIKKDESNTIQVANGLVNVLKEAPKDKKRNKAITALLTLAETRRMPFRNVLLVWLVSHLEDPDFTIQNVQYDVIRRMILNEKYQDFIGELLESFIKQLLTSEDMNPSKQERGRLLVQRIAYNSRKLSKYAIRAFLDLFDKEGVSHSDLWPGLSSFDARLVGIELVESFSVQKSREISEEANRKELGSFSHLLEDIVSSWEKGDMNRLTLLCGTIAESTIRKAHRLSLAQNIKKVGTVPLEILARSVKEDPKELETLVYELIMNDEIHAKLEIVDGRLYIIPIDVDEDQKSKKENLNAIEMKDRALENSNNKQEENQSSTTKEDSKVNAESNGADVTNQPTTTNESNSNSE